MNAKRILITDDNAQNLYLARFLLEQRGHRIFEATTGEQALSLIDREHPDLVLMDIQMPGMDGLEATRRIKKKRDAPPVIAISAKAMRGDRESILNAGCDGYIAKPIDPGHFADNVEAFFSDNG